MFVSAHIEQRAGERFFDFENAVKYFDGYMIMKRKNAHLQELKILVQFVLWSPIVVLFADNFVFADAKFSVLYFASVYYSAFPLFE